MQFPNIIKQRLAASFSKITFKMQHCMVTVPILLETVQCIALKTSGKRPSSLSASGTAK
jgi:hypothetical protein